MRLFDLTLPLTPGLAVQAGDPPFTLDTVLTHSADGYEVTRVCLGTHTGTHVDAPRHFYAEGRALDEFPLERFMGRAVVLDCREVSDAVLEARLTRQLAQHDMPPDGMAVLWTEGRLITLEAAALLLEAGVGLIGVDAPSLDAAPYPVHRLLLARDVLIVENLCGLEQVGAGPIDCAFLPLALQGTDGAPIRAIAWR